MAKGLMDLLAEARERIEEVNAEAAAAEHARGGDTLFLDVREPQEYEAGHVPGAVLVPRGLLEPRAAADSPARHEALADADRPIIVYCASGGRGALAAQTLGELGFTRVRSLAGGFGAWKQQGGPSEAD